MPAMFNDTGDGIDVVDLDMNLNTQYHDLCGLVLVLGLGWILVTNFGSQCTWGSCRNASYMIQ